MGIGVQRNVPVLGNGGRYPVDIGRWVTPENVIPRADRCGTAIQAAEFITREGASDGLYPLDSLWMTGRGDMVECGVVFEENGHEPEVANKTVRSNRQSGASIYPAPRTVCR